LRLDIEEQEKFREQLKRQEELETANGTKKHGMELRFKAFKLENYKIPFGGNNEDAALVMVRDDELEDFIREVQGDLFTGNGFTKSENYIVPEYENKSKVDLYEGTELFGITNQGERLIAVYSEEDMRFISILK
jgi:toxin YxiD